LVENVKTARSNIFQVISLETVKEDFMMVYLTSDSHFNSCYKYLKILGVKESSFIRFTQETVFERCLLEQLTYEIVYKHSSFEAFANAHNTLYSGMSFRAKQFIITFVPIA
jgi:hypothetical protein